LNAFLVAIAFKGIRRCVQAAKQRAVWLSSDCVSGKYLWALPTPTTFEKVDQTFIIDWQINLLNRNLSQLLINNHIKNTDLRLLAF
ncbi:hypothetical protein, partial [Ruminococcus sp.]